MRISRFMTIAAALALPASAMAQTYSIGSNPQGSLAYATAAAIAKVANENAGLKARVVPQGGPVVTIPLVDKGELDFSITLSVALGFAKQGRAMFKGRPQKNIYIAAALFPLRLGFYVRKDSNIRTIADLKGKRLGSKFTKQKIVNITGAAKLATAGLTKKDVIGVPVANGVRQVDDFIAGKIDAVTWSLTSGKTRQAHAAVGIRVLSLPNTPQALAAMQKVAPGSIIETIQPGPRYPGVEGPTNIFSGPFLITASNKTPSDVVYKLVAAIHANKKKLVSSHASFKGLDPSKMNIDLGMPYHPASIKFFKDKGM